MNKTGDMSKLKKIKQLAERGVCGERRDAEVKLLELMNKMGIDSIEEIESDEEILHTFRYNGKLESKLLAQCIYKVMGEANHTRFYTIKGRRQIHAIYCTDAKAMEIQLEFDFYKKAFYEEANVFLDAFIDAQHIYPEDDKPIETELDDEILKRINMAKTIEKRTRNEMLENKEAK